MTLRRSRHADAARSDVRPEALMESLEQRALFDSAALPSTADMRNPLNSVVRLETNFGDIDIELFDTGTGPDAAPLTTANFLKYVRDGDFDRTFFHRFISGFIIQAGLARLQTGSGGTFGAKEIPVDNPVNNEFNASTRSNIARTLAMAKQDGLPNSATSQWFINLVDNSSNLNNQNGGFTVFGEVLDNRSWSVVTTLTSGITNVNRGSPYDTLPTRTGSNTADGFADDELVTIWDAEIIKPQGVTNFYQFHYYYPEGFAGSTINEFLPISNPNSVTASYQVIVRSETAQTQPPANPTGADPDFWFRDKVIKTGTIGATRRSGITLSQFNNTAANLVSQGVPYSIEVWSTHRLSASISHYDFGTATGEAFTTAPATSWAITNVQKGGAIRDFIVWENTSDTDAPVTVTFYFDNANPIVLTNIRTTQAFRRGGLSINDLPQLPDGSFSAVVSSSQLLVAALTHFDPGGDGEGSATLGVSGQGQNVAILPLANRGTGTSETLSFLNTGSTPAVITLIFSFADNSPDITVTPSQLLLPTNRRGSFDTSTVAALAGKSYTVRYSSGAAKVFAESAHTEHGDELANPFAYNAATRTDFAEGFMDPARAGDDLFETISVYNPQIEGLGGTGETANITVRFLYTDGFVVTKTLTVDAGKRADLDVHTLTEVLAQGANSRFFFSVEVVSDLPIVAMMRHFDLTLGDLQPSGGFSTLGTQRGTIVALNNLGA
jgi:cyclophilin family peptidyl-prolyl cis-trans isomerase